MQSEEEGPGIAVQIHDRLTTHETLVMGETLVMDGILVIHGTRATHGGRTIGIKTADAGLPSAAHRRLRGTATGIQTRRGLARTALHAVTREEGNPGAIGVGPEAGAGAGVADAMIPLAIDAVRVEASATTPGQDILTAAIRTTKIARGILPHGGDATRRVAVENRFWHVSGWRSG
jgi:hypothetical protein